MSLVALRPRGSTMLKALRVRIDQVMAAAQADIAEDA